MPPPAWMRGHDAHARVERGTRGEQPCTGRPWSGPPLGDRSPTPDVHYTDSHKVSGTVRRRHAGRNAHRGLPATESCKHGNTLGTTGPCMAGPAATLRPFAQVRHNAFVKDCFPSRPCDAYRALEQLTDCGCGRCRPPSDPATGHPSRGRRCRLRFPRDAEVGDRGSDGRPRVPAGRVGGRCRRSHR
jgi:hypothetical protein